MQKQQRVGQKGKENEPPQQQRRAPAGGKRAASQKGCSLNAGTMMLLQLIMAAYATAAGPSVLTVDAWVAAAASALIQRADQDERTRKAASQAALASPVQASPAEDGGSGSDDMDIDEGPLASEALEAKAGRSGAAAGKKVMRRQEGGTGARAGWVGVGG